METTEKQETALIPTLQLTPFEQTKENLIALASDYKNMVVTKDNMKEANEARLVLYRKRIEIQNVAKANRKTIKEFLKNNNDATEEELIGTIEPTELALEAKIKAIKDAIAEEERIEAERISRHKAILESIKSKTVAILNSTDINWLNQVNEIVLADLEEFQAEGEQLLSTLKETAKNRLELLEFQAAKRKQEEAAAQKLIDDEKAKKDLEEKEAQKGFDMAEPSNDFNLKEPTEIAKTLLANTANNVDSAILEGISGAPFDEPIEAPKLSPLKTVPIGAGSAIKLTNDKDEMTFLVKQIQDIFYPKFESKEATQHCNFVRNMLSKLSEQTLKVAEKL